MSALARRALAGVAAPAPRPSPGAADWIDAATLTIECQGGPEACGAVLRDSTGAAVVQLPNRLDDSELRYIAHCLNRAHRIGQAAGQAAERAAYAETFAGMAPIGAGYPWPD